MPNAIANTLLVAITVSDVVPGLNGDHMNLVRHPEPVRVEKGENAHPTIMGIFSVLIVR